MPTIRKDFHGGRLAKVTEVASKQTKRMQSSTLDGMWLNPRCWHLKVQYYNRTPTDSSDTFVLCQDVYTINCEGVIGDESVLQGELQPLRQSRSRKRRRSTRLSHNRALKLNNAERVYEQIEETLKELCIDI